MSCWPIRGRGWGPPVTGGDARFALIARVVSGLLVYIPISATGLLLPNGS